uniref:peptide-methionine (S)-S-oxide reductase n=1 Tax=Eucampia antarctica TaxID=49252 RepID=A0A7S2S8B7_9STRA|mmetsp:Transcript_4462/g.4227  ORF Transcript_4462/g.4227 Transcript_4462/m.4227 type:complete len:280 (+) Transcript_4462:84-923(+)
MKILQTRILSLVLSTSVSALVVTKPQRGIHMLTQSRLVQNQFGILHRKRWSIGKSPTTPLHMNIFESFFGGGGGSYFTKVDYDTLNHPGPELGQAAIEGKVLTYSIVDTNLEVATFAGGCFWGLELAYQRVSGVRYTTAGYTQGTENDPNYDQVCSGNTGHTESVCVYFDPNECSYEDLLDVFFTRVDPLTKDGQGNDYGRQYRTGVYYHTSKQEQIARDRFQEEQKKYKKQIIHTERKKAMPFWPAEKNHQQFLQNGGRTNSPQSTDKGCTDTIRCYG